MATILRISGYYRAIIDLKRNVYIFRLFFMSISCNVLDHILFKNISSSIQPKPQTI